MLNNVHEVNIIEVLATEFQLLWLFKEMPKQKREEGVTFLLVFLLENDTVMIVVTLVRMRSQTLTSAMVENSVEFLLIRCTESFSHLRIITLSKWGFDFRPDGTFFICIELNISCWGQCANPMNSIHDIRCNTCKLFRQKIKSLFYALKSNIWWQKINNIPFHASILIFLFYPLSLICVLEPSQVF